MLTIRQRTLVQTAMAAVVAFFLALIFSAGFVAAIGWAIVVALAFGFLIRQNIRVSQGVDVLREDVPLDLDGKRALLASTLGLGETETAPPAAAAPRTTDAPPATDTPAAAARPPTLDAPRGDGPDDLTRISGIGPKLRDLLHSKGYYHFDQIAAWSDAELAWIDDELDGFKGRASRDDWVPQARRLAAEKG